MTQLRVVTIASGKGGSTKSATTALLAARAVRDGAQVALHDLNSDQGNLTQWHFARGEPSNPHLLPVDKIGRDVDALRQSGAYDWLFIDTPPRTMDITEVAILKSDAVVVPVRCSIMDVGAVDAVIEMCKARAKPFAFLLSAVDARMPRLTEKAMAELIKLGPIFATRISYRQAYINAIAGGKVAFEIDPTLEPEADQLWAEIKHMCFQMAGLSRAAND